MIDANFDHRLAIEVANRGRRAISVRTLGLQDDLDTQLLPKLATRYSGDDWMLITSDDNMPTEHGSLLANLGATIATLDGRVPEGMNQEHYKCEVVHRWAHMMQEQKGGTIKRYKLSGHSMWTPRRTNSIVGRPSRRPR